MVTLQQVTELIAQLGGLAMFAGTLAAIAAFVYRWYVREKIPRGLGLLVGLAGVAVYLNTTAALGQVIGGSGTATETQVALFNIAAFLAGGAGATVGQWAGDWFGSEVFLGEHLTAVESDVGRLVQSVGRVIAVELPSDIDDVVGYDPVPEETKETLAGKTFLFPRRLTVGELRTRLIDRLKTDYGVGHVDIELADDGSVEYLALGSRAAGIGPTLPPATNAVAIRADPAFAASAGDLVQVWETEPMRRVLTAELRGVADDTVTVAIDAADTQKIDPTTEYRLVTLPVEDRPDREFASLLRAADETFSSVTVEAGSPLHGLPLAALSLSVVAVKPEDGTPKALPDPSTILTPGDVVFAIARPDALRRLEAAGKPLDPALVSGPPQQRSRRAGEAAAAASATSDADEAASDAVTAPDSTESSEATAESGEPATADGTDSGAEGEPADATDANFDPPAATETDDDSDGPTAGKADSSFQQLKEEFDSGAADWAEESERDSPTSETDDGGRGEASDDRDVGDDPADDEELDFEDDLDGLSLGDETADDSDDFDDDLLRFDDEAEDDDLSSLDFEDDEDETLSFDDESDIEGEADGNDGDDQDDDEDSDEDGEGGGEADGDDDDGSDDGASSFQQLKEEFESGDADWEDDISDSPGGDMRLDE